MASRLILRRGEQLWLVDDPLHGEVAPSRYIITASLKAEAPFIHRFRWYPQDLPDYGIGKDARDSQDFKDPEPKLRPLVQGTHLRAIYDSPNQNWTLWGSGFECHLRQPTGQESFPCDVHIQESQLTDLTHLFDPDLVDPMAAVLLPRACSAVFGQDKKISDDWAWEGLGVIWLATPWFESIGSSAKLLADRVGKAQKLLLHRGEKEARGYVVLSIVGHDQGLQPAPQTMIWYDGPLGILDTAKTSELKWFAFIPPAGKSALEMELPLFSHGQSQMDRSYPAALLKQEPQDFDMDFWEQVHRILIARMVDILEKRFFSANAPASDDCQGGVSEPAEYQIESDSGPSGEPERRGNLWISLPLTRQSGQGPESSRGGDFKDLKKSFLVLLLCQTFRESVPIILTGVDKGDLRRNWKIFFENIGAHLLNQKDYEILSRVDSSVSGKRNMGPMIDLELLDGLFDPCPGFHWNDRDFLEMWLRYLNRRVEIVPFDFLYSVDKT